ncbi:MAG: hypothetical protein QG622_1107 [Actinomycetota bacterium]|nr:hypothetical protein [Actinomycetota bacterium]
MAWFIGRTVVVIALAVALGIVIGWLWWRRRKVQFDESQAIRAIADQKDTEIAARDEEIARLRVTARTTPAPRRPAAPRDATPVRTAPPVTVVREDPTAGLSVVPTDPAPEQYAAQAEAVENLPTGDISLSELEGARSLAGVRALADAEAKADAKALADAGALADAEATRHATTSTVSTRTAEADRDKAAHELPAAADAPTTTPGTTAPGTTTPDPAAGDGGDAPDSAEPVEEDDLERVEGIGPRIGAALRNAGIRTYQDLADADTARLQSALEQSGLRFAPSLPTWSKQARFLADGDEAGFQALTRQLVGGRDVSKAK